MTKAIDQIRTKIENQESLAPTEALVLLQAYDALAQELEKLEMVPRSEFDEAVEANAHTLLEEYDIDDADIETAVEVCSNSNFVIYTNRHLAAIVYGDRNACVEHGIELGDDSLSTLALYSFASCVLKRAQALHKEREDEEEETDEDEDEDEDEDDQFKEELEDEDDGLDEEE